MKHIGYEEVIRLLVNELFCFVNPTAKNPRVLMFWYTILIQPNLSHISASDLQKNNLLPIIVWVVEIFNDSKLL